MEDNVRPLLVRALVLPRLQLHLLPQRRRLERHHTERHGWHLHPLRYGKDLDEEVDEQAFLCADNGELFHLR